MTKLNYYIPTHSGNLPHYFGSGIIMPSAYYEQKVDNIQNQISNAIIISEKKWLPNSNCSLEIILNENEITLLIPLAGQEALFEFAHCIPISRIKQIFFLDNDQKETTIWNINRGTAFVPERIITIEKVSNAVKIQGKYDFPKVSTPVATNLLEKAKRFNVLLGGFAFMKLAAGLKMNFPENYFSTLSYFNQLIGDQVKEAEEKLKVKFSDRYIGLFSNRENDWSKWTRFIYRDLTQKDIEEISKSERVKVEKKLGNIKLETIDSDSVLYDLALLATYGINKSKGLDELTTFLYNSNLPNSKIEEIFLIFGLNIGYSKLRNSYKIKGGTIFTKFKLESKLDYYTIESIYLFVFNNQREIRELDYLKTLLPPDIPQPIKSDSATYKILDTTVIREKKEIGSENSNSQSFDIFEAIAEDLCSWQHPILKTDKTSAAKYFRNKFEPLLDQLIKEQITTHNQLNKKENLSIIKTSSGNIELSNLSSHGVNEADKNSNSSNEQTSLGSIFKDGLELLPLAKLKEVAGKKGIKELKKYKACAKDMMELIEIIRNTPTML